MKYIILLFIANLSFASGFEALNNLGNVPSADLTEPIYPIGLTQQNYKALVAPYYFGNDFGVIAEINFNGTSAKFIDDLFPKTGKLKPKYILGVYQRSSGSSNGYVALDVSLKTNTKTVVGSKVVFELDVKSLSPEGAAFVYVKHNLKQAVSKKSNTVVYFSLYTGQKALDTLTMESVVNDTKDILKSKNYKFGLHFIPNIYEKKKVSYGLEVSGRGKFLGILHYDF